MDVASGAEDWAADHGVPVPAVAWSPDGSKIATGCWDGKSRFSSRRCRGCFAARRGTPARRSAKA